jgi:hypothetical protein
VSDEKLVPLREIAAAMGMDRSHARRWIKERGYTFQNVRDSWGLRKLEKRRIVGEHSAKDPIYHQAYAWRCEGSR